GTVEICSRDEFLARSKQERPHVALVPDVVASKHLLKSLPAPAEKYRVFSAVADHPVDKIRLPIHWRHGTPVVSDWHDRCRRRLKANCEHSGRAAGQQIPPAERSRVAR